MCWLKKYSFIEVCNTFTWLCGIRFCKLLDVRMLKYSNLKESASLGVITFCSLRSARRYPTRVLGATRLFRDNTSVLGFLASIKHPRPGAKFVCLFGIFLGCLDAWILSTLRRSLPNLAKGQGQSLINLLGPSWLGLTNFFFVPILSSLRTQNVKNWYNFLNSFQKLRCSWQAQ